MKHDFHFVLNSNLKNKIIKISKVIDSSISSTIIYIILLIYPKLEEFYFFIEENSKYNYKFIDANCEIHIYMDVNLYRKIRKIHSDMFVFSMAILIRWMIEIFFAGVEKYGFERFIKIMQKYKNIHNIRINKFKSLKKYEINKHMYYRSTINEKYRMTYNENFTLLGIELLN